MFIQKHASQREKRHEFSKFSFYDDTDFKVDIKTFQAKQCHNEAFEYINLSLIRS